MASFTRRAIMESCMELLKTRPVSKITIKDIVEHCGINRNTFYYHFEDLPTLLEEIVREEADRIAETYEQVHSLSECLDIITDYVRRNRRAILHIYGSARRDLFEHSLFKICDHVAARYMDVSTQGRMISDADRSILILSLKCSLFGLAMDWMEKGMREESALQYRQLALLKQGAIEQLIDRAEQNGNVGRAL